MAITSNNVQNVKFLRNGTVFTSSNDKTAREVAIDAMNGQKDSLADGTAILGRYQGTNGTVMTLVGFAYAVPLTPYRMVRHISSFLSMFHHLISSGDIDL